MRWRRAADARGRALTGGYRLAFLVAAGLVLAAIGVLMATLQRQCRTAIRPVGAGAEAE